MKDNLTANSPTKELAGDEATNDVEIREIPKKVDLRDVFGGVQYVGEWMPREEKMKFEVITQEKVTGAIKVIPGQILTGVPLQGDALVQRNADWGPVWRLE